MTEARAWTRLTAIEKRHDELEQRQADLAVTLRELSATQVEILFAINQCLGRLDVLAGAQREALRASRAATRRDMSAVETRPADGTMLTTRG